MKRRTLLTALLIGTTLGVFSAAAQEFPKKQPIKIVVAFNAGALTDTLARITADFLQRRLGQAVVVENRPGAAGAIALDYVAKSPPDGYTLYMSAPEIAVLPAVRPDLPAKIDDFTFLVRGFTIQPLILAAPDMPFSSTKELVEAMKANPGKLRYGTAGVGHISHLGAVMFEGAAGVKGVHVPYTGFAAVYQDLLAGNIDFTVGGSTPFPDGIKVLGPSGTKRHVSYPDLPTLKELGIENAEWDVWFGLVTQAKVPKATADLLISEISAVFKDPEAIAKFKASTKNVPEENPLTGDAFKKQVVQESQAWKAVAERNNIKIQQ